ncbi:Beta-galactosidase large subunit, partial [sediment metagenome]
MFKLPATWRKKQILLNFEAADWETTIWIDGKEAGIHRGGYDPFSFNITEYLDKKKNHELLVCIKDPSDKGTQPRGKQVSAPEGIWYTPTTGIWQTVWLEPVNESYISSFRTISDIEKGSVTFKAAVINPENNQIKISILRNDDIVATATDNCINDLTLIIPDPELWTSDNPFLYNVLIELQNTNKTIDKIESFVGLRKISSGKTFDGFTRLLLNDRFIYQNGPLDQGFWPDGIYTPPSENAMVFDLQMNKKMGST